MCDDKNNNVKDIRDRISIPIEKCFGPGKWGPALDDEIPFVETPIGKKCGWCGEEIRLGDYGLIQPSLSESGLKEYIIHRECQLRTVLGAVNCQKHGPGKVCPTDVPCGDDPTLTKRQAALAAVAYWKIHHQEQ